MANDDNSKLHLVPDEVAPQEGYSNAAGKLVSTPEDLRRIMFLISAGLFITTIGQPKVIGNLPFLLVMKKQMHLNASQQANFWAVATIAWYCKPLAGLLVDSFPIFGTRRKAYLVLSSIVAGICWVLFAVAPHTYSTFFWLMIVLNSAMVIGSTVTGGVLVEAGQEAGATGRLTSVRYLIDNIISIITGPLGGWLAAKSFGLTAGIGACLLFSLAPAAMLWLREPRTARLNMEVWSQAAGQFKQILGSWPMWAAAALLFLVFVAPGFGVVLQNYQLDEMKFSTEFIGVLGALGGIGGILATALYAAFCRKFALKPLLFWGVLVNALSSLLYLGYHSRNAAIAIDFSNGFFGTLGVLPLFDMCARATPKGSEGFGYSLLMSVYNVAIFAISQPFGSYLYELKNTVWFHSLMNLVWLNTGTSLIALVLLPILPAVITKLKEGEKQE